MNRASKQWSSRLCSYALAALCSAGLWSHTAHALDAQKRETLSATADQFFRSILSGGTSAAIIVSELEAETREEYAEDSEDSTGQKSERRQPKVKDLDAFQSLYESGGGDFRVLEHVGGTALSDSVFVMPQMGILSDEGDDEVAAQADDGLGDDLTIDPMLATDAPLFVVLERITKSRNESPSRQHLYQIAVDGKNKIPVAFRVSGIGDSVANAEQRETEKVFDQAGADDEAAESLSIPELPKSFILKQIPKFIKAALNHSNKVPSANGEIGEIFQGAYRRVVLPEVQK